MVYSKKYKYHKMYFVVSLDDGEPPSFNVVDYVNVDLGMGDSFCEEMCVKSITEWNDAIKTIIEESSAESIPIIYVECHGDRNGNLVIGGLNSKMKIRMKDFLSQIKLLKEKCHQKILLVTAICYGLNFYRKMSKLNIELPLSCVIGSYTKQSSFDIHDRYKKFFKELLKSKEAGNVNSAFHAMGDVYEGKPILEEWAKGERYGILTHKSRRFLSKNDV